MTELPGPDAEESEKAKALKKLRKLEKFVFEPIKHKKREGPVLLTKNRSNQDQFYNFNLTQSPTK